MAAAISNGGSVPGEISFSARGLLAGARRSVPLALSVAAYGAVFGMLARQAGLSLAEAVLMSGLVFAGSAQLVALGLWTLPLPVVSLVLTTLVVNLRYLIMGAALWQHVARLPLPKLYGSLFFLSDESWALSVSAYQEGERDHAFLVGSGLILYIAWVTTTAAGHLAGGAIGNPAAWGLDFTFTGVFVALLAGRYTGRPDLIPWAIAAIVALLAAWLLPGKWYVLLGGVAGSLIGGLRDGD